MLNLKSEELADIIRVELCKLTVDSRAKPTPIMMYELKVLRKILQNLAHGEVDHRQLAELQVRVGMLQQNEKALQDQLIECEKRNSWLTQKLKEATNALELKEKHVEILNAKCEQLDRLGGKYKIENTAQELRRSKERIQELQSKLSQLSKRVVQSEQNAKIYKEMCKQQEGMIAELKVQETHLQCRLAELEESQRKQNSRHRGNKMDVQSSDRKGKMEAISLRQKIRQLNQEIEVTKRNYECARQSWQKKEKHYSRLLEKYFLQDEPL